MNSHGLAGNWAREIDARLLPLLIRFHDLPRSVLEKVLDWETPAELYSLSWYLNGIDLSEEKVSLNYSIGKVFYRKTCCRTDAKLVPMLMGMHNLPLSISEMVLSWLTQAELSGLASYLGPVKRCEEKASLLGSIAKVSQLKTYELAVRKIEPPLSDSGKHRHSCSKLVSRRNRVYKARTSQGGREQMTVWRVRLKKTR